MEIYKDQCVYSTGDETLATKCQRWGVLWKKPLSTNGANNKQASSSKWSKRFFIIKEGFLLYYPENEKREFEKKKFFNLHPKGVIPLGGCIIEAANDPHKSFTIKIEHEDFNGPIVIATDSEPAREKWMDVLKKSCRITWKNAELGDSMIQTLEKQSRELARDSQRYREQVHAGAEALREEMDKSEELEKIAQELETEKLKIEETAKELLEEKQRTQLEMEETLVALRIIESEKEDLSKEADVFQKNLKLLEQQREETLKALNQKEEEARRLADKNLTLESATVDLRENLSKLDEQRNQLECQMHDIEESLKEKEVETEALEEEKAAFGQQVKELESSIQDLSVQKDMTDQELKEEIIARRDAERRLKDAEQSLSRLEDALRESRKEPPPEMKEEEKIERDSVVEEQIFTNVANLKKFFEDIAMEAKIDANKPIIMKNAVHARKSFVRKTKSFKMKKDRDKRFARHSFASFSHASTTARLLSSSNRSANRHSLAVNPDREQTTPGVVFDLSSLGIITEEESALLGDFQRNSLEVPLLENGKDAAAAVKQVQIVSETVEIDGPSCQSQSTDETLADDTQSSSFSDNDSVLSEN